MKKIALIALCLIACCTIGCGGSTTPTKPTTVPTKA
jgi:hypothetical protein